MMQVGTAFEDDRTGGIVLEYLLHTCAEMIMEGRSFPYAYMASARFIPLIDLGLDDDGDALHEEDTAEERHHQFLMNDHGADTDDTAYGEAARIAEEDLRGETVEPEVTDECADERCHEDHQFFGTRDIHNVEILCPYDTTARICEDEECDADDGRVTGTHAVHAVVEVGSIADSSNDEDGEQHEEDPSEAVSVGFAGPGEEVGVVEVMMLDERDGGLSRFDLRRLLHHNDVILDMTGYHLVHAHGRAETKRQTDDQTERHLTGYLDPTVKAVFILAEGLDIIIREAQRAHEEGGDEHEDHIDVGQLTQQQTGDEDSGDDDKHNENCKCCVHIFLLFLFQIVDKVGLRPTPIRFADEFLERECGCLLVARQAIINAQRGLGKILVKLSPC